MSICNAYYESSSCKEVVENLRNKEIIGILACDFVQYYVLFVSSGEKKKLPTHSHIFHYHN